MFTSLTLVAMLVGYVVGLSLIPRFISQSRYLSDLGSAGRAVLHRRAS